MDWNCVGHCIDRVLYKRNHMDNQEVEKMTTDELINFMKLLKQLPTKKQREFYYMVKGAAFVAEKTA